MPEFTTEQIELGIMHALKNHDIEVIPSLITVLALQDADRAEEIRQTILFGLRIAAQGEVSWVL